MEPSAGSLVLYKSQPAVVRNVVDKKLALLTGTGEEVRVRPKDVQLLHPGPFHNLDTLTPPAGDPTTAWELLAGQSATLADIAELAYGEFSPRSAWATWLLIQDGLFFSGTPQEVVVHAPERVAEIRAARAARRAEEVAWSAFLARVNAGTITWDDERYLAEVVELALARSDRSRVLRALGRTESPEEAHELLLQVGYWSPQDNPYPIRLRVHTDQPVAAIGPLLNEDRRDLTHLTALAIDDEDSGDPDDALSYEDGRLWVHIADVGALVAPGSPADLEARNRAANLYLPEGTIRMLPGEVTERLALGLQTVSPALSLAITVDALGIPTLEEIVPSRIRTTRLSYESAEFILDQSPLRELQVLTDMGLQRRLAAGAIEIDLPEVKVRVAQDHHVSVKPLYPTQSRKLVREAMLMAGEAVAGFAARHAIPLPHSTQAAPQSGDMPQEGLAHDYAQRRLMQRAVLRAAPGRHSGLGLDAYVQVTSPLRRYLDLVVHQQLRAYLAGHTVLDADEITRRIGTIDAIAGDVRTAERQSVQHWTLVYLLQHPGWGGDGIVVEQRGNRSVVLLPDLAWETEIYFRSAPALNAGVTLRLSHVDLPRRQARFEPVEYR